MPVTIRSIREEDAAAVVDLLNPIIEAGTHTAMEGPVTLDDQVAFIRAFPPRGVFNVAVSDDGAIVGCQDVMPAADHPDDAGEISTFVALGSHRRGIGTTLTDATLPQAAAAGFREIIATIRADNPTAIAFYRSRGFADGGGAAPGKIVLRRALTAAPTSPPGS